MVTFVWHMLEISAATYVLDSTTAGHMHEPCTILLCCNLGTLSIFYKI